MQKWSSETRLIYIESVLTWFSAIKIKIRSVSVGMFIGTRFALQRVCSDMVQCDKVLYTEGQFQECNARGLDLLQLFFNMLQFIKYFL